MCTGWTVHCIYVVRWQKRHFLQELWVVESRTPIWRILDSFRVKLRVYHNIFLKNDDIFTGSLEVKLLPYGKMQPGLCKESESRERERERERVGKKVRQEKSPKKEDPSAQNDSKGVKHCVFRCLVILEGRKVGLPKRRARRYLATERYKICTTLWRESGSHNPWKLRASGDFEKFKSAKLAPRCDGSECSRSIFGSSDPETLCHFVVRERLGSQNGSEKERKRPRRNFLTFLPRAILGCKIGGRGRSSWRLQNRRAGIWRVPARMHFAEQGQAVFLKHPVKSQKAAKPIETMTPSVVNVSFFKEVSQQNSLSLTENKVFHVQWVSSNLKTMKPVTASDKWAELQGCCRSFLAPHSETTRQTTRRLRHLPWSDGPPMDLPWGSVTCSRTPRPASTVPTAPPERSETSVRHTVRLTPGGYQ